MPLGTQYPMVVQRIAVVAEAAQSWGSATVVLDGTGVGVPIVDMLRRATSVPLRAVVFTAGDREVQPEFAVHRVPKRDLVTALEVVLQTRPLEVTPDCVLKAELESELAAFDLSISARGHDTYEAASGSHDDLVMALCLALWWGERPSAIEAYIEYVDLEAARRGFQSVPEVR